MQTFDCNLIFFTKFEFFRFLALISILNHTLIMETFVFGVIKMCDRFISTGMSDFFLISGSKVFCLL